MFNQQLISCRGVTDRLIRGPWRPTQSLGRHTLFQSSANSCLGGFCQPAFRKTGRNGEMAEQSPKSDSGALMTNTSLLPFRSNRDTVPRMSWRQQKRALNAISLALLVIASGCAKMANRAVPTLTLFKVKSPDSLPTLPTSAKAVDLGSLSVRAAPLLTDEETQELFEANFQLAGLLPVRLEMTHNSGVPIEVKKLKFTLRDDTGSAWKSISVKQAISRILSANDLFVYNPHARKTFEEDVRAYDFKLKDPLTHEERQRQGLIFFLAPGKQPVSSPHGLVLSIEGLAQPVSLNLN